MSLIHCALLLLSYLEMKSGRAGASRHYIILIFSFGGDQARCDGRAKRRWMDTVKVDMKRTWRRRFNGGRWLAVAPREGDKRREENICIASSINTLGRSLKPDVDRLTYFFSPLLVPFRCLLLSNWTYRTFTNQTCHQILLLCPPTYWKTPCMKWY